MSIHCQVIHKTICISEWRLHIFPHETAQEQTGFKCLWIPFPYIIRVPCLSHLKQLKKFCRENELIQQSGRWTSAAYPRFYSCVGDVITHNFLLYNMSPFYSNSSWGILIKEQTFLFFFLLTTRKWWLAWFQKCSECSGEHKKEKRFLC